MLKNTLFRITAIVMLLTLTACGTFFVSSPKAHETSPTPIQENNSSGSTGVVMGTPNNGGNKPPSTSLPFHMGLVEIIIILSLILAASAVVGAYFLIRDRTPKSDYPQPHKSKKRKKSIIQLLRFKPDAGSLILALCTWAILLGIIAIFITWVLVVIGRDVLYEEWEPALTQPSAITIGANYPRIRLNPEQMRCMLATLPEDTEQLLCDTQFEDALLTVDVTLENGMNWYCSAFYAGESVPCQASFDMSDHQTYIIFPTDLGLTPERYQQLVDYTFDTRWGEKEWLGLARAVNIGLSLTAMLLLWRSSAKYLDDQLLPQKIYRSFYVLGISLMIFGFTSYISTLVLIAFKLID